MAQLRKQRFVSTPSPTLSLPPRLDHAQHGPPKPPRATVTLPEGGRKLGDGGAASDGEIERTGVTGSNTRKQPKRRESHSRRHTLQNGIDYGLLKRMKAIEEERDGLMRGVQTVQRAEEWYQEQLHHVQDSRRRFGMVMPPRWRTSLCCKHSAPRNQYWVTEYIWVTVKRIARVL